MQDCDHDPELVRRMLVLSGEAVRVWAGMERRRRVQWERVQAKTRYRAAEREVQAAVVGNSCTSSWDEAGFYF